MIFQLRRWLPHQLLVMVADSTYAALELLAACQALSEPWSFGGWEKWIRETE
jgi:hypothetical protein